MGLPTQAMTLEVISVATTYTQKNSISVINQSADALTITDLTNGGNISLNENQSVTLTSSTGFVLPTLILNSVGAIRSSVITT